MKEYIDRIELNKVFDIICSNEVLRKQIAQYIDSALIEDVRENKHGHWTLLDECANAGVYCSVCSKKVYKTEYANQKIKSKYCPNCGSIMDEEFEVV